MLFINAWFLRKTKLILFFQSIITFHESWLDFLEECCLLSSHSHQWILEILELLFLIIRDECVVIISLAIFFWGVNFSSESGLITLVVKVFRHCIYTNWTSKSPGTQDMIGSILSWSSAHKSDFVWLKRWKACQY